jgi:Fur family transcriptional regulator, peroxide stress response regulator
MNCEASFTTKKISQLETRCRERNLPLTVQRRVIMETLAGRLDHPTADQIYESVLERLPGISRTTVYRVLEAFVILGVSQRINNPEAKAHFDADTSRHHHVRCTGCGAVGDVHDEGLNALQLPAATASGFELVDYSINFIGTCRTCREAAR